MLDKLAVGGDLFETYRKMIVQIVHSLVESGVDNRGSDDIGYWLFLESRYRRMQRSSHKYENSRT